MCRQCVAASTSCVGGRWKVGEVFVMEASVRDAESVESVAATRIAASQSGDVRFSAPRGRGSAGRRSAGFGGGVTKTHRRVQRAVIRVLHRVQQLQAFQQRLEPFLGNVERLHESLPREDVERDVPQRHAPGLRHREHVVLPRLGPGPVRGRHRAPAVQRSIPRADAAPWRMHVARGPRASFGRLRATRHNVTHVESRTVTRPRCTTVKTVREFPENF